MDEGRPIYLQIAEQIESSIVDGSIAEESPVPSTNELAAFHRINPATAAKGVAQLVTDGVIYKRRGIGMFVAEGARAQLLERRRERFLQEYVTPLMTEAAKLGLDTDYVSKLIDTWKPKENGA
ncbi:GntR family transcriptional regulator [Knoellia koreensis]|uniref:GntR family transcriptional regulator n=1 Tax=Knoellia koreensis TaxID=2730921 RepID=A0A849HHB0_9MICO|nr:GntR family transcriptional regulator [Knoellia sp. DB2414S]NNM45964.1 GntR family transcriptional regulator [Knoellia sp. DB2414S]